MKHFISSILIVFITSCMPATAASKWHERDYQEAWCNARPGLIAIEYRLPDKTRIDCLFEDYALEVDWDRKWAEGSGQSLYYAAITGKKPAVLLIMSPRGERYLKRLMVVANKHGIIVFTIEKRQ